MCTTYDYEEAQAHILLDAIRRGQDISWVAHGDSMSPCVVSGSTVTITPLDPQHVKRGEVGLFILEDDPNTSHKTRTESLFESTHQTADVRGQRWILHRVIKNDQDLRVLYTRGDHLPRSDTPFTYTQYVGVLKCTRPSFTTPSPNRNLFILLSRWLHQHNARSLSARIVGLFWVTVYPLYHRLKYRR